MNDHISLGRTPCPNSSPLIALAVLDHCVFEASQPLAFSPEHKILYKSLGLTDNAGVENAASSKLQGWKTREWKTRHQVQGRIQDLKLDGVKQRSLGDGSPQWDPEAKPR